jgi:hypothetical protein
VREVELESSTKGKLTLFYKKLLAKVAKVVKWNLL